jgi:CubicO group peptidase (beta-lactamase class C family)
VTRLLLLLAALAACRGSHDAPRAQGSADPWAVTTHAAAKPAPPRRPDGLPALPVPWPSRPATAHDATAGVEDLAPLLEPERAAGDVPAIGATVYRGPQLVAIGAVGTRKRGDAAGVLLTDHWHLGSDTKAMTAVLIGLYIDRGKLHFDDTLGTLFAGEHVDPGYANVTIRQLLAHQGGAPAGSLAGSLAMRRDAALPDARKRWVLGILAAPPAQAPGTYVYSNDGFIILGAILERITGQSWEDLMQRELFAPLHMSCGFGPPTGLNPWGHPGGQPIDPASPTADNPPTLGPAGRVNCTLGGWGAFATMILAGARGEKTLLTRETMAALLTAPPNHGYMGGWILATLPAFGGEILSHDGSNTMWYASAWILPAKNLVVLVTANDAVHGATIVPAIAVALIERFQ